MITVLPTIELAKLSQIDPARMVEVGNNAMKIELTHPLPCHMSAPSSFAYVAAYLGCCISSNFWKAPATKRHSP
jgi:hypothetical protein